ncbi:MAG: hypothetical protein RL367_1430 [Pseudomonadota bacterium]|jgi:uncharacterized protein (DUF1800 family)
MADSELLANDQLADPPLVAQTARALSSTSTIALVAMAPLLLEACGGDSAPTPTPTPIASPPPPPVAVITATEASRFLGQASMGATKAEITSLTTTGYSGWLDTQLGLARPLKCWDFLANNGYNVAANISNTNGYEPMVWNQLIASSDALRQRVGLALLDMIVVSIDGFASQWKAQVMAAFFDVLWDNAFGNYRDLIEAVSTNIGMGYYLTFLGNTKANAATGSVPDENYARELMQLFTIGLYQLNMDGSLVLSGGNPVETYSQADVSGLARVWTGYTYGSADNSTPDRQRLPMLVNAAQHETGVKTFLGTTIPAGTDGVASRKLALDTIFAHANVAPFVSKQLIQHLVTSNPSPAYIGRVAAVFANNGNGVRGDIKAVIRAILTDSEARSAANLTSTTFGKLREPVVRLTQWARAFGVTSPTNLWPFGNTSSTATRLGESPGHSPSVFNFFRPGYTPGGPITAAGLVAPEFQITNEPSVIAYINYMQTLIVGGAGEAKADYTAVLALVADSQALLAELNLVLAAGQISAATIASMKTALDTIATTTTAGQNNRLYAAIVLVMAAPEYLVLK